MPLKLHCQTISQDEKSVITSSNTLLGLGLGKAYARKRFRPITNAHKSLTGRPNVRKTELLQTPRLGLGILGVAAHGTPNEISAKLVLNSRENNVYQKHTSHWYRT